MNDLVAFDLNQLQVPTNRWEMLIRNTDEGGPPTGQIPPARTNHSVVTYNEKTLFVSLKNIRLESKRCTNHR